jgi:hypothetical protein
LHIIVKIWLRRDLIVGEPGAGYGYFKFKMSRRVGDEGIVYANDIDPAALQEIGDQCKSVNITNTKTVLAAEDDPRFPVRNLDMVVVFDCLFIERKTRPVYRR